MKILAIVLKDLVHSLRSAFLLVMMFVAPLLITLLIYLAFGGMITGSGGVSLPRSTALVVNLDRSDPASGLNAGGLLAQELSGPTFSALFEARPAADEMSARRAVDARQADVAVIIPADFTQAVEEPQKQALVTLYHHPDSALGAAVVKVIVSDFVDGFTGAKIAVQVAGQQSQALGMAHSDRAAETVAQTYVAWLGSTVATGNPSQASAQAPVQAPVQARSSAAGGPSLITRPPASAARPANQATLFLGPVMAGMMVFFMFFTGAAAAQSILYEEQDGTLARLFTTPASRAAILAGKFLAVVVMLLLQSLVLLAASALVFKIHWGQPAAVALLVCGVVVAAAGFGILLMSFIRTTRQAGPAIGLVVTLTGMLGGLMPVGDPSQPPAFEKLTLALPQGWAQHGWRLILAGGGPADVLVPFLVLLLSGAALFAAGALLFRRRFQ